MAVNNSKTPNDISKDAEIAKPATDTTAATEAPAVNKTEAAPQPAPAAAVNASEQAPSDATSLDELAAEGAADLANEAADAVEGIDPALAERIRHADTVIQNNVYLSAAAGVIPIALVDTAALIAVQIKMLRELAAVHNVEFRANLGKSSVAALLGSVTPTALAQGVAGTGAFAALTAIPVLGPTVRALTMPVFGAAFTYAVGKIFAKHFASGGTFLTFDAKASQEKFKETFEKAKKYRPFTKKAADTVEAPATDDAVPAGAVPA